MKKSSKYQVIKSNNYVLSHYNMSLCTQKILNLGITKIKRDADPEKQIEVEMTANEIKHFLGYSGNNVYKLLDEVSDELQSIRIVINNTKDNGRVVTEKVQPFPYARYDDCHLTIRFEKFMNEHLLQLSGFHTQYDALETRDFKCKYTTRMFEICQCIAYKKSERFELNELKEMIGVRREIRIETKGKNDIYEIEDAYPKWTDMKRYALERAQKEMREKCSICFEYETHKTGRTIDAITISVIDNVPQKEVKKSKKEKNSNIKNQIEITEILAMLDECRSFLPDDITSKEINDLLAASNYDIDKIRRNYELSKTQNIESLIGWMIVAIKEDYAANRKTVKKSKNSFVNFNQREYDYDELESILLNSTPV